MKSSTIYFVGFALIFAQVSAQVGINTVSPKTIMDVSAKRNTSGNIEDNLQVIGLQPPRLTRAELTNNTATYAADQTGALIYITDISGGTAAGQRININVVGYYYFDGTLWQKVTASASSSNIYNTNGTLTGTRTLTQTGFALNFNNTQNTRFVNDGGTGIVQDSGTGTRSSILLSNGGVNQLQLFSDTNSASQIIASNTSKSLSLGTSNTNSPAPITFVTSTGSSANALVRMVISATGNVGIGGSTPTSKFQVSSGDIYVDTVGSGIILRAPNGNCFRTTVSNAGILISTTITCP